MVRAAQTTKWSEPAAVLNTVHTLSSLSSVSPSLPHWKEWPPQPNLHDNLESPYSPVSRKVSPKSIGFSFVTALLSCRLMLSFYAAKHGVTNQHLTKTPVVKFQCLFTEKCAAIYSMFRKDVHASPLMWDREGLWVQPVSRRGLYCSLAMWSWPEPPLK